MATTIYSKEFQQLTDFTVKEIYTPCYRSGGIKKPSGFEGKTFKQKDGQWYEQTWEDKKPILSTTPAICNKDWYMAYGKVYDIVVTTPTTVTIKSSKGDKKDTEFNVRGLGVAKIKDMLREDFDLVIPTGIDGKEVFDWEDSMTDKIKGCTYKMRTVKGDKGMSCKFKLISKAANEVEQKVDDIDNEIDYPF